MRRATSALLACALVAGCGLTRAALPPVSQPLAATPLDALGTPPEPATPRLGSLVPAMQTETLPNGLSLVIVERHDAPIVAIDLACRASGADDARAPRGIDTLLERVLAAEALTIAPELAENAAPSVDVASIGASISADATTATSERLLRTIARLARAPIFDRELVHLVRGNLDRDIGTELATAGALVDEHTGTMLYGEADPRSGTWYGERAAFRRLDVDELRARHRALFAPRESVLVVVGDVDPAAVRSLVDQVLGDWSHTAPPSRRWETPTFPQPRARLHGIPTGGEQSVIRMTERGPHATHPDVPAFEVVEALLGGMFGARLNRVLREEQGYTYGVGTSTTYRRDYGVLRIAFAVPAVHTRSTILALVDELRRVGDASRIEPEELEHARMHAIAERRARFATRQGTASAIARAFLLEQPVDMDDAQIRAIASVSAEEVARVARTYLRPEGAPIVVAGEAQYLFWSVSGIPGGYEFVERP